MISLTANSRGHFPMCILLYLSAHNIADNPSLLNFLVFDTLAFLIFLFASSINLSFSPANRVYYFSLILQHQSSSSHPFPCCIYTTSQMNTCNRQHPTKRQGHVYICLLDTPPGWSKDASKSSKNASKFLNIN